MNSGVDVDSHSSGTVDSYTTVTPCSVTSICGASEKYPITSTDGRERSRPLPRANHKVYLSPRRRIGWHVDIVAAPLAAARHRRRVRRPRGALR